MKKRIFILAIIGLLSGQSLFAQFATDEKRKAFNFRVVAGVNAEQFVADIASEMYSYDYGEFMTPNFGVELEYIFPFNKNKFTLVFGANYHSFKKDEVNFGARTLVAKYGAIDFPIGVRHYIFINNDAKIFFNGFYQISLTLDKKNILDYEPNLLGAQDYAFAKPEAAFSYGGGFEYKKFSIQVRFYSTRDLLGYTESHANYQTTTFLLGYKL